MSVTKPSWRAVTVSTATAAVCVASLWVIQSYDEAPPLKLPASNDVVAADYADIAGWKHSVFPNLLPVFVDNEAMKDGQYLADRHTELCVALTRDTAKAMNNSRPAPDDQTQKHFVAMLTNYKSAADKCVSGDMDGSYAALQIAEKEQAALGVNR